MLRCVCACAKASAYDKKKHLEGVTAGRPALPFPLFPLGISSGISGLSVSCALSVPSGTKWVLRSALRLTHHMTPPALGRTGKALSALPEGVRGGATSLFFECFH